MGPGEVGLVVPMREGDIIDPNGRGGVTTPREGDVPVLGDGRGPQSLRLQ